MLARLLGCGTAAGGGPSKLALVCLSASGFGEAGLWDPPSESGVAFLLVGVPALCRVHLLFQCNGVLGVFLFGFFVDHFVFNSLSNVSDLLGSTPWLASDRVKATDSSTKLICYQECFVLF